MQKNVQKLAQINIFLYLCTVIKKLITSGMEAPDVAASNEFLIPQKTHKKV